MSYDLNALRAMTDAIDDADGLVTFGKLLPSKAATDALAREIDRLCVDGHKVSLIMADVMTGSGAAYRSGVPMCAQSTVKAVYAGALVEQDPNVLNEHGQDLRDAIEFSDNDAYARLRDAYGPGPLRRWCAETGVGLGFADVDYPRTYTARDMFRLWTRLFAFLEADDTGFRTLYTDTSASATRKRLGGRYRVYTKAGWECGLDERKNYDPDAPVPARFTDGDPANDECAVNDTGVVYAPNGPYIFVIYTDHPFGVFRDYATPNPLYDLADALYEYHASLGGI